MSKNTPLLEGQKFNKLTVIKLDHIEDRIYKCQRLKSGKRPLQLEYYLCKCDCGNETIVEKSHLRKKVGATESCGCVSGTHHLSKNNRIYAIWTGIRKRCLNKNKKSKDYKNYIGRGVKMCKSWENDFVNFYNWSLANGYADNLTIDRIDNNGNYEPLNCRWISKSAQAKNRRGVYKLTYNGKEMLVADISKITGIKHLTILSRYRKYGLCDKVFSQTSLKTGKIL